MTLEELEKENGVLKTLVQDAEKKVGEAESKLLEADKKVEALQEQLNPYLMMGSADDIQEAIDTAVGRITTADANIVSLQEELATYQEFATIEELQESITVLEQYSAFATTDELPQIEGLLQGYTVLGEASAIAEKLESLDKFSAVGTLEELTVLKEESAKLELAKEESRKDTIVTGLMDKFKMTKESAIEVLELKGWDEPATDEFLSKLSVGVAATAPKSESTDLTGTKVTAESTAPKSFTARLLASL